MKEFEKLEIDKQIIEVIKELKFKEPTKIQKEAIPLIREGKDVIGGSATGSGKTLAFAANIIEKAQSRAGIQALILTPTRELAEQVKENIKLFSKNKKLKVTAIYGGVSINPQIKNLERAEIVVGTPGRLLVHLRQETIDLRNVRTLVLDEADMMLDMGFLDDVEMIIKQTPKDRQTLLFSATIEHELSRIAKKYMNNPIKIAVERRVDPKKLEQIYFNVNDKQKFSLLVHILKTEKKGLVMVFCNSRKTVDFVTNNLKANNIESIAIHGGLSQDKRSRVMDKFKNSSVLALVCTDVAARGLDFKDVGRIYNYDIPNDPKQYLHRIGRTARAGKEGEAINILASRDHENFSRVLDYNDLNIPNGQTPKFERAKVVWTGKEENRGRGNFRSNNRGGNRAGSRGSSRGGYGGHARGGNRNSSQSSDRRGNRNSSRSNNSRPRSNSNSSNTGNKPPVRRNLRR